jgi:hypothetical protein
LKFNGGLLISIFALSPGELSLLFRDDLVRNPIKVLPHISGLGPNIKNSIFFASDLTPNGVNIEKELQQ